MPSPHTSLLSFIVAATLVITAHANDSTPTAPQVGSYFTQWGIYGRHYTVRSLVDSQSDRKLTFLNYAFGNVFANGECGIVSQANARDGEGDGDASADYLKPFAADESVDGVADSPSAPLRGNFGQLQKLKTRDPQLKLFISIGGWTRSRHFSSAAATEASRRKMVSSCVDLYIKGNLPRIDNAGGAGVAADLFDGIDIDWEFPGGGGDPGNEASPEDRHNFTLLLAEFRRQLDVLGEQHHRHYYLTAAINVSEQHIKNTEVPAYSRSVDWINAMTYDFHGIWEKRTNFVAPLYHDPDDPTDAEFVRHDTYDGVQSLLAAGMPRNKIMLGITFFGTGWRGVKDGGTHGLYQTAAGAATLGAGNASYAELKALNAPRYFNAAANSLWTYDGDEFWTYDDPNIIASKVKFAQQQHLGGVFSWSIDGDDKQGSLLSAMAHIADSAIK